MTLGNNFTWVLWKALHCPSAEGLKFKWRKVLLFSLQRQVLFRVHLGLFLAFFFALIYSLHIYFCEKAKFCLTNKDLFWIALTLIFCTCSELCFMLRHHLLSSIFCIMRTYRINWKYQRKIQEKSHHYGWKFHFSLAFSLRANNRFCLLTDY